MTLMYCKANVPVGDAESVANYTKASTEELQDDRTSLSVQLHDNGSMQAVH